MVGGPDRSTPLILAVSKENYDVAKLLLEFNADPHLCDRKGKAASDLTKNPKILKLLSKAKELFDRDEVCYDLTLPSSKLSFTRLNSQKI